jgi:dTDP-glucose pyrophosphorylase
MPDKPVIRWCIDSLLAADLEDIFAVLDMDTPTDYQRIKQIQGSHDVNPL